MRKSIALFGCLALLGAPMLAGTAHAGSSTSSTPGAGIMPGNGSTVSTGPDGNFDSTISGSTLPVSNTGANVTTSKNQARHHPSKSADYPDASRNGSSSDTTPDAYGNNGNPGRGRY
jgi:hypothetical protein